MHWTVQSVTVGHIVHWLAYDGDAYMRLTSRGRGSWEQSFSHPQLPSHLKAHHHHPTNQPPNKTKQKTKKPLTEPSPTTTTPISITRPQRIPPLQNLKAHLPRKHAERRRLSRACGTGEDEEALLGEQYADEERAAGEGC